MTVPNRNDELQNDNYTQFNTNLTPKNTKKKDIALTKTTTSKKVQNPNKNNPHKAHFAVEKQKKNKKHKKEKFIPTDKIKNIKINTKKYLTTYIIFMICSCSILLAMVISMMILIPIWWVWLIDLTLLAFCLWRAVRLCLDVKNQSIYTLYSNCIVVQSLILYTVVELKDICDVTPCPTHKEKNNNISAHSIAIYLAPKHKNKVVIGFIDEDVNLLCEQIIALATKCKENIQ